LSNYLTLKYYKPQSPQSKNRKDRKNIS